MSLRRKILVKDVLLLAGLSAIVAGCLWGLFRQRQHVQASLGELSALRQVEDAQYALLQFQQNVSAGQITSPEAVANLQNASLQLRRYKAVISQYDTVLPPEITPDLRSAVRTQTNKIVSNVVKLVGLVSGSNGKPAASDPAVVGARLDELQSDVAALLAVCNGFVDKTETTSGHDLWTATVLVIALAALCLLASVAASLWQHRRIMVPLENLRMWCRRTADRDFSTAYKPSGESEFQELAKDVNQMAADLDAFYRKLEAMVTAKSRELVRCERLASIGYLAAGVAHEINTPLNVISGYAELSMKRIARSNGGGRDEDNLAEHLSIIRGEAFRCKEITEKLLSLTRGGGAERSAVDVGMAVSDVAVMVRGLRTSRDKRLTLDTPSSQELLAWANATEVKQVLLNLVINAVEAVPAGTGEVRVAARGVDRFVEVTVSDNGRGMTELVREQVFEPFFTDKRGSGEPGTGLGLSVTHAIVMDHGGLINVHSDGPGRGSQFTVRLPAASKKSQAESAALAVASGDSR